MIRIIFGILILIGLANQFIVMKAPTFDNVAEMQGYVAAKIAFLVLAIWLISSGIKKRRAKQGKTEEKSKMGMIDFFKSYFGGYKAFLHKNIELKKPPYWLLVIWFYGVVRVLVRLDSSVAGIGFNFNIQGWFDLWVTSLVLGAVIGFIGYWLVGSIFHLGVLLAGGHKKAKTSRMIFIYSGIPHTIAVMALFFVGMLALRENYFLNGGLDPRWFYISGAASFYSIVLGYIGAVEVQKTKKIRSILLFLVVPIALYASIYLYSYAQSQADYKQMMQSIQTEEQ
ncbi:MAG: Yip1 family protein [Patescibacteria group bacterium]